MRYPCANTTLLILLVIQLLTGFFGLIGGGENFSWVLWLHGIGGYGLTVLLYWKGTIIFSVLKRRWRWSLARLGFLALTLLLAAILATGLIWSYAGRSYLLGMSLINIHGLLAVILMGLLAWHTLAKWYIWRVPKARNRRAFLRLGGLALAGLLLRQLAEPAKALAELPGAVRRFTGSYEIGSFTGIFPATSWLFDRPGPIANQSWRLVVEGAVERPLSLTYGEITRLAGATDTVLLDCTGGFYTLQEWTGLPLARLLELAEPKAAARSVTVEAVSGYGRRFSLPLARRCLLATDVAGQPLTHGHGAPLRLVVPDRRGYDWVKWVTRIRVNETGPLLQPPLPLQ